MRTALTFPSGSSCMLLNVRGVDPNGGLAERVYQWLLSEGRRNRTRSGAEEADGNIPRAVVVDDLSKAPVQAVWEEDLDVVGRDPDCFMNRDH